MTEITLRLLGPMEVLIGGEPVELPTSRKTRALLAYLALSPRRQRRERLCEIFWDVPDDPRGSLRWSLSKIRQVVNVAGHTRLGADRNSVWLDRSGLVIDRDELAKAAERGFDALSTEQVEALADTAHGAFLEDISMDTIRRATTLARRAIVLDDRDAMAHMVLGLLHLLRCHHDEPIVELETAIDLNPSYAEAHHGLGFALIFAGRPEDAVPEFDSAIITRCRPTSTFTPRGCATRDCRRSRRSSWAFRGRRNAPAGILRGTQMDTTVIAFRP